MRKILSYLFIFYSTTVFAQYKNELKSESTDIYVHAFGEYSKQISITSPSVKRLYIRDHSFYSSTLPARYQNIDIQRVSDKDISNLCRKNKYVFVTEMIVLRTNNKSFYITIIPFKAHKKGKGFEFINDGGLNFNYVFNSEKSLFYFQSVTGGIPKIE